MSKCVTYFILPPEFTLGDRINNHVLDLLEHYVAAYYTGKVSLKIEILNENNLQLERLRFLIRLAHDFKLFSNQRVGHICGRIINWQNNFIFY